MNYKKHYNLLIERARNRDLIGYYEKHHIVPRCLGGTDDKANLVCLTPEEHYLAHLLLTKIYLGHFGLIKAAHIMSVHNSVKRVNNKKYGWLRRNFSKAQKQFYKDKNNHPKGMKGKKHSSETIEKIKKASQKISTMKSKKVYQWDKHGNLIKEYASISDAAKELNTSPSNIKYCCEGKFKHVKTYLWSYKNSCPEIPNEVYSKTRKVHTDNGVFDSLTDVIKFYNFSSSKQVRYRCQRDNFPNWYYLD